MVNQSGTSEMPSMMAYPHLFKFGEIDIQNMFCYVLEHPGKSGLSCIIFRDVENDKVSIQMGDWEGNILDLGDKDNPLSDIANKFLAAHGNDLYAMMKTAAVSQAMFYIKFGADMKFNLIDVRLSANKFAGPGFCRDIFGKVIEFAEVIAIEIMTDELLKFIEDGNGNFARDLIIKPSKYRNAMVNGEEWPLYIEVVR
jgi:hypothetical protein